MSTVRYSGTVLYIIMQRLGYYLYSLENKRTPSHFTTLDANAG